MDGLSSLVQAAALDANAGFAHAHALPPTSSAPGAVSPPLSSPPTSQWVLRPVPATPSSSSAQTAAAAFAQIPATPTAAPSSAAASGVSPRTPRPPSAASSSAAAKDPNYNRKNHSLGVLCDKFLSFCDVLPLQGELDIDAITKDLGAKRRRIYEILNVLEALGLVVKRGKSTYCWLGYDNMDRTIQDVQRSLCRSALPVVLPVTPPATPSTPASSSSSSSSSGGSSVRQPIPIPLPFAAATGASAPADVQPPSTASARAAAFLVGQGPTPLAASAALATPPSEPNSPPRRACLPPNSLGYMTRAFLSMFAARDIVSLPDTQTYITNISGDDKSKSKRLYDIANILCSLKLINKAHGKGQFARGGPYFSWLGRPPPASSSSGAARSAMSPPAIASPLPTPSMLPSINHRRRSASQLAIVDEDDEEPSGHSASGRSHATAASSAAVTSASTSTSTSTSTPTSTADRSAGVSTKRMRMCMPAPAPPITPLSCAPGSAFAFTPSPIFFPPPLSAATSSPPLTLPAKATELSARGAFNAFAFPTRPAPSHGHHLPAQHRFPAASPIAPAYLPTSPLQFPATPRAAPGAAAAVVAASTAVPSTIFQPIASGPQPRR